MKMLTKIFLRYCQYVGEEAIFYRHILRKWYIYKLSNSIFNYNPTIYDLFTKKYSNVDLFQIDAVIISFKGAFDKINNLLKPSTNIWNKINEKTPI